MLGNKLILIVLSFVSHSVWACPTCGSSFSFTPKMFLISIGFFLLPLTLVGFIVWRVWKDQKDDQRS